MRYAVLLITCAVAFSSGWFLKSQQQSDPGSILRFRSDTEKFISPVLMCDIAPAESFGELRSAESALRTVIDSAIAEGIATDASAHVRILDTDKWFEIRGTNTYAPASLFKIFSMIAYLKKGETNPAVLGETIVFTGTDPSSRADRGAPRGTLVPGNTYTKGELIEHMITRSDNDAYQLLMRHMTDAMRNEFDTMLHDLRIPLPDPNDTGTNNFISPRTFSTVFRILYNASYLSRETSIEALKLLSRTDYSGGIVSGVPPSLTVAHKFGVRTFPEHEGMSDSAQLHDCGIVYHPRFPYLLCIMTKGADVKNLEALIEKISRATYNELDSIFSRTP